MIKSAVMCCLIAMTTGCVDQPEDTSAPTTEESPRIAVNGLTPTQMWNSTLNPFALTSSNLTTMSGTADNRATLAYAIYCALPTGTSVQVTIGGVRYTYPGAIGLAPEWATSNLSASATRWVSACVLSRVNLTGLNVTISLRGTHTALGLNGTEGADYQIQEGAFYGNILTGSTQKLAYACNGIQQAANDTYGDLPRRECAEDSACGFTYMGLCSTACTGSGPLVNCTGDTTSYAEVVTSYLFGLPQ